MPNARIVVGITGTIALVTGLLLMVQEKQEPDCHKRYWCGEPEQARYAWLLIVIGAVLHAIKCVIL